MAEEYSVEENVTMLEVCLATNVSIAVRIDVNLTVLPDTALCEFSIDV